MRIKFYLEEEFDSERIMSHLISTVENNRNEILNIEIYVGEKPLAFKDVTNVGDAYEFVIKFKTEFDKFVNKMILLDDNVISPKEIHIGFVNELTLDNAITNIEMSKHRKFNIRLTNFINSDTVLTVLDKKDTIKNINMIKYIYVESEKLFNIIWNSPDNHGYSNDDSVLSNYSTERNYVNAKLNVDNIDEIIENIKGIPDDSEIEIECDYDEEASPYLFKLEGDYSIVFKSNNEAIRWALYANIEYKKFKNSMTNIMVDNKIDNDISLFLLRYI